VCALRATSRSAVVLAAGGLLACVALADDRTGPEASFTLLYLGPIAFATWFAGLRSGLLLSLCSAVVAAVCNARGHAVPLPRLLQAWNLCVHLGVFVSLAFLLAALKSRLQAEQRLARTDPLTGIPNRRAFVEAAAVEIERMRRTGQPITVAYLDCDDFKRVNDLLGHVEGDLLLAAVGATLRDGTRAIDVVARLGGDEFGLLLIGTDGPTAEAALDRLRDALLAATRENGWGVNFSVGAVTFLGPPRSVDDMIGRADELMYAVKRDGKGGLRHEVVWPGPRAVRVPPGASA
jgi:diguanylate cyclase (GGDEF)-like protein